MEPGTVAAPPTAVEDMSIVQKCEQLEACLAECHAAVEAIEGPTDVAADSTAPSMTPGAHASLNRLGDSSQRLLSRLNILKNSIGQV